MVEFLQLLVQTIKMGSAANTLCSVFAVASNSKMFNVSSHTWRPQVALALLIVLSVNQPMCSNIFQNISFGLKLTRLACWKENIFVLLRIQYFMDPSVHTYQQWKVSPAANLSSSNPSVRDGVPDFKALHRAPSCCHVFVPWNRFEQPLFGPLRDTLRIPDEETICPQEHVYILTVQRMLL